MLILALDTSMAACSACVFDSARNLVLAARLLPMQRGHAEALAPMVQEVIAEAGIAYADLVRIGVTTGPGTFTGVRIGLALARGLGVSLGIPVIGISSLAAIACNVAAPTQPILVASDARGDEFHVAVVAADGRCIVEPALVRRAELPHVLPSAPCILLGTGADGVKAVLPERAYLRSAADDLPVAANFAWRCAQGEALLPPPEPLYLRPPDVKLPVQFTLAGGEAAKLLAALHGECFAKPWDEASFVDMLVGHGNAALIASVQFIPAGFVLFRHVADEAEIITICTRAEFRQKRLAASLLKEMEKRLQASHVKSVFLEVGAANAAARALYDSAGFREIGLRKNYYTGQSHGPEDAITMRKDLAA